LTKYEYVSQNKGENDQHGVGRVCDMTLLLEKNLSSIPRVAQLGGSPIPCEVKHPASESGINFIVDSKGLVVGITWVPIEFKVSNYSRLA